MKKYLQVGVGVMILDCSDEVTKILLGKRNDKNTHGCGEWALPGGHVDWIESEERSETTEEAAVREVFEETGLKIKSLEKVTFTDDPFPKDKKYYLTVYYTGEVDPEYKGKAPQVKEPNKIAEWRFFPVNELPENLFVGVKKALEAWDWGREISWLDAIITEGKEFTTSRVGPADEAI